MKTHENRGGYRPNAGRKPVNKVSLGTYQTRRLLKKARKRAGVAGKDHNDVLLDIIHGPNERTADRLVAIKHLNELLIPKISEGGEADRALGPAVFLPEHHPRLTLVKTDAA